MTKLVHLLFLMLCMAMLVGFTSSANTADIKVLCDGPLEPALTRAVLVTTILSFGSLSNAAEIRAVNIQRFDARDLVRTKEWFDVGVTPHEGPASRFDPFRRWDFFGIPAKLGRCVAECRSSGEPS